MNARELAPVEATAVPVPRRRRVVTAVVGALPALVVGVAAMAINDQVSLLGPLLLALVVGAVAANIPGLVGSPLAGSPKVTKLLLRLGVVLLGLGLPIGELAGLGISGVAVVVITVAATYTATTVVGRRLGLDSRLVTLIAAGFSICGAAAIAAMESTVKARQRDVGVAIVLVTLYGTVMIVAAPPLAGLIGLSRDQTSIWIGASVHEVAQVVAAAAAVGSGAVALAITVKLGRVLLLAPLHMWVARRQRGAGAGGATSVAPWFVVGFALAVAFRSTGVLPADVLDIAAKVTTLLLASAMFGLGLGIRARDLRELSVPVFALGAVSTLVAAATSLALVAVTM